MKGVLFAAACVAASCAGTAATAGPSSADEKRFSAAKERFVREQAAFDRAVRDYRAVGGQIAEASPPRSVPTTMAAIGNGASAMAAIVGFDAASAYRDGPSYPERVLGANELVYRGSDLRYYCRRDDASTGLIIGATGRGLLGSSIEPGKSRTVGALIADAGSAFAGKQVSRDHSIRCR